MSAALRSTAQDWAQRGLLVGGLAVLAIGLVLPMGTLLQRAFSDEGGAYVGLANFAEYLTRPALRSSLLHSLWVSSLSTLIVVALAFAAAYIIARTRMPGRELFRAVLFLPLLTPSLLAAVALVYWFGAQGVARALLFGASLHGPIGIVLGSCFWTLPFAFVILATAFANADGRLYEAARMLGAPPLRVFLTVTLPSVRYGLISAACVVFTRIFTDFGVPKVIGGQYNVIATDVYKQVIGQQNFNLGAAISLLLLVPAVLSFLAERWAAARQGAVLTSRATLYVPPPNPLRDALAAAFALALSAVLLAVIGMAFFASFVTYWPYDLAFTLGNYSFEILPGSGWGAFGNSLLLSLWTALAGTPFIFLFAYLAEKGRGAAGLRSLLRVLALVPLGIPGMALGLGYIFFFNSPANPLNGLYGTLTIMVLGTVIHAYSVPHITVTAAVAQLDREFEAANSTLGGTFWRILARVTVPVCLPAVLDVAFYLFVTAMTTVSAVVFLYSPHTVLASIAVLNLDDSGEPAGAAAMACLIVTACGVVRLLQVAVLRWVLPRTQRWRNA